MIELLLADQNFPFAVSLGVMVVIALLEGVGALFGLAFSQLIDQLLPDFDAPELAGTLEGAGDLDMQTVGPTADLDNAPTPGPFVQFLGWLTFGRVPALILLIVFLTAFGLAGILLQQIVHGIGNFYLPSWIAVVPAFAVALPTLRAIGLGLAKVMPEDHTEAVSQETFVGRIATIVRGRATTGAPAEAKLTDSFGMTHYVLIEPDLADTFAAGDEVLVVSRAGSVYRAIRNTSPSLSKQ